MWNPSEVTHIWRSAKGQDLALGGECPVAPTAGLDHGTGDDGAQRWRSKALRTNGIDDR
jgi:hypothetical protein